MPSTPLLAAPDVADDADDAELIAAVRAGDDDAFAVLVAQHRPRLVRLCASWLRDDHLAEDIAQDTLLKAHHRLRNGDDRPLQLQPWLDVVARNACVDLQRRRDATPHPDPPTAAWYDPEPTLPDAALGAAWDALDAGSRQLLTWQAIDERSYRQIALGLGISLAAVRGRLARAREALRSAYLDAGGSHAITAAGLVRQLEQLPVAARSSLGLAAHPPVFSRLPADAHGLLTVVADGLRAVGGALPPSPSWPEALAGALAAFLVLVGAPAVPQRPAAPPTAVVLPDAPHHDLAGVVSGEVADGEVPGTPTAPDAPGLPASGGTPGLPADLSPTDAPAPPGPAPLLEVGAATGSSLLGGDVGVASSLTLGPGRGEGLHRAPTPRLPQERESQPIAEGAGPDPEVDIQVGVLFQVLHGVL